jgi:allantoinase
MTEEEKRQESRFAIASIERCVGERPIGWYCRYASRERTRRLLAEEGGFLYDADDDIDDRPYYVPMLGRPWRGVPYSADANDGRYVATSLRRGGAFGRAQGLDR